MIAQNVVSFDLGRTRSSFASPMHERETMQPQSATNFNFNNGPQGTMDQYKEGPPQGIFRTDTSYTDSSMEKGRFGDAQSVHSIPPAYATSHHANANQGYARSIHHTAAGDLSGATLLDAPSASSHDNHDSNNAPIHQMLSNVNTALSSFKPVPPPGSRQVAPPRVEEPSYPPRM